MLVDAGPTLRRRTNSFVLLCLRSLTTTVCDEARPRQSVPSCFAIIRCLSSSRNVLHNYSLSACDQSLTLSASARSLFLKSTPSFQRVHSLIGVTDNLCLEFFNVRFQNCDVVLRRASTSRRNDHTTPQTVLIGASRSTFASFHSFREWNLVRIHRFLRLFVCVVGTWRFISSMSTIVFMYHIRGASNCLLHLPTHWYLLHPPLDQELHLWKLNSLLPRSTLDS